MEQTVLRNSLKLEVESTSFSYLFPTIQFRPIIAFLSCQPYAWFYYFLKNEKKNLTFFVHHTNCVWSNNTHFQTIAFSDALYFAFPFIQINCTPDVLRGVGIFTSIFWPSKDGLKFDLSTTWRVKVFFLKLKLEFKVIILFEYKNRNGKYIFFVNMQVG